MRRQIVLLMGVLLFLTLVNFYAANSGSDGLPPYSLPRGDEALRVIVELTDGNTAEVVVRNGTLMAAEGEVLGELTLGFAPLLKDGKVGWLPLKLEGRHVNQLPPLKPPTFVSQGEPLKIETEWGTFRFTLKEVTAGDFPLAAPDDAEALSPEERAKYGEYARSGRGRCCVPNAGWSLCGASVEFLGDSCITEAIPERYAKAE